MQLAKDPLGLIFGNKKIILGYWRLFTNWLMAMWKARLHKKGIVTYPVPFYPDHVSFVSEFLRADYAAAGLSFPSSEVIYGGVPADKFFCQRE